jgi:tRNA threonylcarbamoyladenosine biosynthesis protein TsaE
LADTLALAEKIGSRLKGGEVIELVSDLGGGKTAFVTGLARGMGSQETVSSPSFTLNNVYDAGKLVLQHFDFYRLNDPGILRAELAEVFEDSRAVVAVEWGGIVNDVLPENRLIVHIEPTSVAGRHITLTYPSSLEYLVG